MTSINSHRKGATVRLTGTGRNRRLAPDFPGWGAPDYADYFIDTPDAGLTGTVTSVESHGMNPWTRYSVRFSDGTSASGLVEGKDIEFA